MFEEDMTMPRKLKVGIIGIGFIGVCHIDAIRRITGTELVAVADANAALAKKRAEEFGVPYYYDNIDDLVRNEEINVIHNCTPNHMHFEINSKVILAGKHIFSEKPLARTCDESAELIRLLQTKPDIRAGVNYCYRMNPLIQDAKNRIAAGEIGKPFLVHGSYLQDWMLYDTDYNWRVDPVISGDSRTVADIGTHWMDTAQVLVNSRIREVCATTVIAHPYRKKSKQQVETFSVSTGSDYELCKVETEDYAGVLIRFENGASGLFQCSEISAGRKCYIEVEVNGSDASFNWQHETSDHMWKGNRDKNNELIFRNPNLMTSEARKYTYLAAGHSEGWNDAFKNNLTAFYHDVLSINRQNLKKDYATFEDAHYLMKLTNAILESGKTGQWVTLEN